MKIIYLNAAEAGAMIRQLMGWAEHFSWAVAWATNNDWTSLLLKHHSNKIKHLVVGTDFSQTSPEFIDSTITLPSVRRASSRKGVTFHPKVYGFVKGEEIAIIIGSSNLTAGGLSKNDESCLCLQGSESDSVLIDVLRDVEARWNAGECIDVDFAKAYRRRCELDRTKKQELGLPVFVPKPKLGSKYADLLEWSWSDYHKAIIDHANSENELQRRLDVLKRAREFFSHAVSFNELSLSQRKAIAGFISVTDSESGSDLKGCDWLWFGSMRGAGVFKQQILLGNQDVSDALNEIPISGNIAIEDYRRFAKTYQSAFAGMKRRSRIASASRLLALKRPDYFLCIDGANLLALSEVLGVPKASINFENYWERVVHPIMTSNWWHSHRPESLGDGQIWDGRVAMLDILFYQPTS